MRYFVLASIAVAGLMALPSLAQPPENDAEKDDRPRREQMRERMLKEFDKDGDGKLSDEERQTARDAMRERFGRRRPDGERDRNRGPRTKDGKGRKGDRDPHGPRDFRGPGGGPPPEMIDRLFKRFDKDENDSLSRDEFAKLAEFMHHHRHHRPGPPPGSPRFDGRGPDGPPPGGEEFRRRHRPYGPPGPPPRPTNPPGSPPKPEAESDEAI